MSRLNTIKQQFGAQKGVFDMNLNDSFNNALQRSADLISELLQDIEFLKAEIEELKKNQKETKSTPKANTANV